MKKIIAIILATLMALSLCACGDLSAYTTSGTQQNIDDTKTLRIN